MFMAQLWYKTRGESSPDRKQKVYFSAHPKDYHLLDGIAAEILEHQNCAVWYDKEPEAEFDEKEFSSRLEEMQLFVMPVTSRLLTQPNRALEFEFALAQRRHIPVLPLMQEDGLEALFNEKCGDLQFLYKYSRDTTGISYEEKLKKYLEAVLVGEEDAKRIRDAFAAYIFLSYRKKDREHAQKLMRLIHKVDFCRDVAIWYDEFLTPGENFTNLIKESLDKSDLFVLAVTPNLLERKNYVMQVEYPMAIKSEKPILPAEMVDTKERKLRKKYKDIPDCVDAYEENELRASLEKGLGDVTKMQNNSPEQLYLMGLAYLNGVDVERDEEKAIHLITAAAEQEHVEALEKIVQLYREGFGVKRNYETAIEWQRKLVDAREKLYRETESEDNAYMFFSVLWDLGDYIYELKKIKEAREVYMRMLDVSLEFTDKFSGFWAQRDLSVSYEKLGDISTSSGDLNGAKEYYQKGLDIRLAIAEESDTIESRRDLSISYNKLGDICEASGDLAGAKEYYQKGLDICLAIAEESDTIESRRDLSVSYDNLGDISTSTDDLNGAKEYYQKGLDIRLAIAEESDTIEARRDLSVSYNKLGNICEFSGDLNGGKEYYQKSLDVCLAIKEETGTIEAYDDLAFSYYKLGVLDEDDLDLDYLRKAYDIWSALSEQCPDVAEYVRRRDIVKDLL